MLLLKRPVPVSGECEVREEKIYTFANYAETNECVRISEIEIHTAVLLENEEHRTGKGR